MWQNLVLKLGPINVAVLKKVSLAYVHIGAIRACEESIRSDLQGSRPARAYQFLQSSWSSAGQAVDAAIEAIGQEMQVLTHKRRVLAVTLGEYKKNAVI